MGIWCEHFSCVEITKAKIDLFKKNLHDMAQRVVVMNLIKQTRQNDGLLYQRATATFQITTSLRRSHLRLP